MMHEWSSEQVMAISLPELNPAQVAAASCYSKHCYIFHVVVSQIVAEPSLADVINYSPLGANDAHITVLMWFLNTFILDPLIAS